jgi:hypothetical protein
VYRDTFLGKMFNEYLKSRNVENEYFFDRNGYAFRYVLEYHRTGQILWTPSNESGVNLKEMILEYDYFEIPNDLKELDKDDKDYDLDEVRELFRELSDTTFPSTTSNKEQLSTNDTAGGGGGGGGDQQTLPSKFGTTENQVSYPPKTDLTAVTTVPPTLPLKFGTSENQVSHYNVTNYNPHINHPPHKIDRIRRWTTPEEHAQILDSFLMALSDVIYEIHRNLRGQINFQFHSRSNQNQPSIEFDLDLDSIKEIMKPFRASGYKLLEWYGIDIEKKLKRDFNDTIAIQFLKGPQKSNTFLFTITILMPFNSQYIKAKSSVIR